jgi:hypothetical protein
MFTIIWGTTRRLASRSGKNGHRRTHPSSPFERLEPRRVLSAAFDLVGLTALRADPLFAEIDGQLPWG